jgi:hypothetical protein
MVIPHRALVRTLLAALVVAVVALVSPAAYAAAVPMCGEDAQSIAAPPMVLPSKGHVLERVPCPERDFMELGSAPNEGPRPSAPSGDDAPQRVCPTSFGLLRAPRSARLSVEDAQFRPQRGILGSIERPPRRA